MMMWQAKAQTGACGAILGGSFGPAFENHTGFGVYARFGPLILKAAQEHIWQPVQKHS
jgi:hypothetical protein